MKNLLLFLLLFSFCGFSQTNKEKELQKEKDMQNMYLSFLNSEGFKGEVGSSGDIKFKNEGLVYYINVSDDEYYFEIQRWMGNSNDGCSNKIKKIVKETCFTYKSLTVKTVGDDCASIKLVSSSLLVNKKDFEGIFYRSLNILKLGKNRLDELYSEE